MKIKNLKTYLTTPSKCYIPKCKARCCADAPLSADFLAKHKDKIQRPIYKITNIGHNDPRDTYDSVMFNTTGNPIQVLGIDQNGQRVIGIPKDVMEKMQIKSMEQIQALMENYEKFKNYCPFLTDLGKCNVYKQRPPICREFGTSPEPINQCPSKATPLEVLKGNLIEFPRDLIKEIWKQIRTKNS